MDAELVFLSYAKEDSEQVRRLHARLQRDGVRSWLDEHDLLPGQDWDQVIRSVIRRSKAFVLVLSGNAITKAGYIQKEVREALAVTEHLPEGRIFVVPVRLEECPVPDRLAKWHWIDLFKRGGYQRLLRTLKPDDAAADDKHGAIALTTEFASPAEHLLYDIVVSTDRLLFSKFAAGKVAISQGHLLVVTSDISPPFAKLKRSIGDASELPPSTITALMSPDHPWRRLSAAVHTVRFIRDRHHVILKSDDASCGVNLRYFQLAAVVAEHPTLYVTAEMAPVYVEANDSVVMILMPLRLTGADRPRLRRKSGARGLTSR